MIQLGAFQAQDGKIYDLFYFPDECLGQAIGPIIPGGLIRTAGIAEKVHARSESEAKALLIEKLAGITAKGPTFFTTIANVDGTAGTSATTMPLQIVDADSNLLNVNASANAITRDNPDLKPIETIIAQHLKSLMSGDSMEEKIDPEAARKVNKAGINITYAPVTYHISGDAYVGEHVNSMGPISNTSIVNQTWGGLQDKYKIEDISSELRKLSERLDAAEDQTKHLGDVALIEKAANEMDKGCGPKALKFLSGVSQAAIEVSKEIGTNIAAEVIMRMTGLR
jgi:hypothetical protein